MKLYNSLTKTIEPFHSITNNEIKMYVCGITPYNTTHLGHAFTYMIFDVLQRYFTANDHKVTYVQNVTDIDDDILKRANLVNQDWMELGKFWTDKFLTDLKAINIQLPTHYVKATHTIPTIIEIIKALIEKGYAYENAGNVYFDVQKDKDYGKLSRYSRGKMIKLSKERGANPNDPLKKDSLDFILWQKSLSSEPYWESKWSKGRPGWHIECSAMAYKYLDKYIDIHGGGSDLIYPHHESEIAQSEQFTGEKPFSRFWMHTGAVGYEGEKMSKSLGNLVLVSDLLKTYSPNAIRYLLLSHHYRKAWEYHQEDIDLAQEKISEVAKKLQISKPGGEYKDSHELTNAVNSALEDDLNTPLALEILTQAFSNYDSQTIKHTYSLLGLSF